MKRKKVSSRRLIAKQPKDKDFSYKEGLRNESVEKDIEQTTTLKGMMGAPVYIHNSTANFLFGANKFNTMAKIVLKQVLDDWRTEARELIEVATKNENIMFAMVGITGSGPAANRKKFIDFVKSESMKQTATMESSKGLKASIAGVRQGDKNIGDIKQMTAALNATYARIANVPLSKYLGKIPDTLGKRLKIYNDYVDKYGHLPDETVVKDKNFSLEGMSTRYFNLTLLPAIYEAQAAAIFEQNLSNKVFLVSGNTQKGTSADIKVVNEAQQSFSVSVKSQTVQQQKSRILNTFLSWEKGINKQLSAKGNQMTDRWSGLYAKNNFVGLARYIIMNYAYSNLSDSALLEDVMQVLAVTSLNEKLFGYGKKGQGDGEEDLATILSNSPAITINADGDVIFMSDLVKNLITTIEKNLRNFYSYSIMHTGSTGMLSDSGAEVTKRSRNNPLYAAKRSYIQRNPKKVSYNNMRLDAWVKRELFQANSTLEKSILIQIQYKIKTKGKSDVR